MRSKSAGCFNAYRNDSDALTSCLQISMKAASPSGEEDA